MNVILISSVLLLIAGCNGGSKGLKITIEGGGKFPEHLAGTWKGDQQGWEVVIEKDGTISSAVIPFGQVRVKPSQKITVPMKMNKTSVYESGQWAADYDPATGELAVTIVIDSFHVEVGPNGIIDGRITESLFGMVDEKENTWRAEWYTTPVYIVNTDELKDHPLETNPDGEFRGEVVFTKDLKATTPAK